MGGYPQFSFWISIGLVKIYISCIITHRGKKHLLLVGTVLNLKQRKGNKIHPILSQQEKQKPPETFPRYAPAVSACFVGFTYAWFHDKKKITALKDLARVARRAQRR